MSRVIKNSQMQFSPPIIIDLFKSDVIVQNQLALSSRENISFLELQRQELNSVKLESQKILQETEQMVLELLEKARREAEVIINDAREEAELIKKQSSEEAEQEKVKIKQVAYEEGFKQAQEEMEADRQMAIEQCREILEEARMAKIQLFRSCENDMVQLVIAIAKKVIAGELTTSPNLIVNVLQEAIAYLDRPENITVYVNPQDLESVLKVIDNGTLTEIGCDSINIDLKADERVTAGGGILESGTGMVDAQLETRMATIFEAIEEAADEC